MPAMNQEDRLLMGRVRNGRLCSKNDDKPLIMPAKASMAASANKATIRARLEILNIGHPFRWGE